MGSFSPPDRSADPQLAELLLDAVTDYAIYMLDPEGFVATWNVGAQRVTEYRPVEIIGQHFSRFFTPEDRAEEIPGRLLRDAKATGRAEIEGWHIRRDGSRFWVATVIHPVRAHSGESIGFVVIARDNTERMEAQEALRESERRFRLLVEGVSDYALYMLDPSGVVTNWNTGAQHLKGYSAEEIVGRHFSTFYVKEDRAAGLPMRYLEIARREGRFEAEGWRVRKDGSRFWASVVIDAIRDEEGTLIGFAKITRDITERQAAQEALRESERQFRLLVEGVSDYALYLLDPNGIITNWNAGARRIKGYEAEEIIGQHFSRFYPERERAAGMPARALHIAAEEGRFEAEGWRVRKDGTLFWANVIIDPIRDEQGALIGFAKITRDITERREAQIALQEAQVQRSHSQKMEALGQLTGGVAHDFNNLLMVVSGHIQTIKHLLANNPKAMRAAEAIEQAARRGESLTRQLLTFSRRQTLNPVVVDLRDQIESFRSMLASSVGASTKLVVTAASDVWPVKVDVNEFELALLNLALNSRDAMGQGGVITITAENAALRPEDTPLKLEGDFVAVTVADTGCGIAADILPKVFDPFFTTKQVNRGSGLGLSQVHGFVHQSGGTVTIASELGQGTRITLYLPRALATPEPAAAETASEEEVGGTVLLVEDNPEVADVTAALMEQLGYTVQVAGNAEAALEAIERRKFDLVMSDIIMAGAMDGVALARTVRERHPELPVILVTGYSNAQSQAESEFSVLRKPYRLADLSRATAKAIAEARQPTPSNLVNLRDARRELHSKSEPS